jgi:ATP-dependent Zn protease
LLIWAAIKSSTASPMRNLSSEEFSHEIAQDDVREITMSAPGSNGIFNAHGILKKSNMAFKTTAAAKYEDWLKALTDKNVKIAFESSQPTSWMTWLSNIFPVVLILGLWILIMRSRKGSQEGQRVDSPGAVHPQKINVALSQICNPPETFRPYSFCFGCEWKP